VAQTSARDMDLTNLNSLYGNKVCIHGAMDSQKLLVYGSQYEIKEEIKKARDLWGKKGGLIFAPSHLITPDTPAKNILAFYEGLKA
ncbi:MAG: uroporphyrinogen decarboxylase family protein, partial [Candidatus Humimicrobiaceae bacterium]